MLFHTLQAASSWLSVSAKRPNVFGVFGMFRRERAPVSALFYTLPCTGLWPINIPCTGVQRYVFACRPIRREIGSFVGRETRRARAEGRKVIVEEKNVEIRAGRRSNDLSSRFMRSARVTFAYPNNAQPSALAFSSDLSWRTVRQKLVQFS